MAKKEVLVNVKVDTGSSAENIKGVTNEVKDLGKTSKETSENTKKSGEALKHLSPALGGAKEKVGALSDAFRVMLLNPVVLVLTAIVGTLALLYKAFTSTNDGADKMQQIFTGLSAVLNVLRDRFLVMAEGVGELFKGNFSKAADLLKASFKGIGEEIANDYKIASEGQKRLQELEDEGRKIKEDRARFDKETAELREKASDNENYNAKQRLAFLEQLKAGEAGLLKAEQAHAANILVTSEQMAALSDQSDETLDHLTQLRTEADAMAQQSAQTQRTLNRQMKSLRKEIKSDDQKAFDDMMVNFKLEEKARTERNQLEKDEETLMAQWRQESRDEEQAQKTAAATADIIRGKAKAAEEMADEEALKHAKIENAKAVSNALSGFAALAGEQTEAAKALSIANALINTYQAANQVLADPTLPTFAKIFATAGIVAQGLANVKNIRKTKVPSVGQSGMYPAANAPAPIVRPISQMTQLDGRTSVNTSDKNPQRVYVLEKDITTRQRRVSVNLAKATIG